MQRIHLGYVALLAAFAISTPAHASALNVAPPDDEDEFVLEEDEEVVEEAPEDFSSDDGGGLDFDTSFLDGGEDNGSASNEDAGPSLTPEERRKIDEKLIQVVQRQRFLNVYKEEDGTKKRRIELTPIAGISVNDPYVRHYAAGLEASVWLNNRLAIGLNGNAFFGTRTAAYDRIRYQEGMLLTANRYLWQASGQITYEPFYGKIAVFNRYLMHWEAFTQLGGGVIHTQTLSRFGDLYEPFDNFLPQANATIGARFYNKKVDWMSVNFGVRTWGWIDHLEPRDRGPGTGETPDDPLLEDPINAKNAAQKELAFNSVLFMGVSVYLPTSFRYSTPR